MQEPQEMQVLYPGWEDPLEKEMTTTPVFLPGEFHGQRSLVGYSPWSHGELDTTQRLSAHSLQSHSECRISEFWITAPSVHTVRLLQASGFISINRSIQNLVFYVFLLKDTWVTIYCSFVTIQQQHSNSGLNPADLTHPSPFAHRNTRSHFNSAWGSF